MSGLLKKANGSSPDDRTAQKYSRAVIMKPAKLRKGVTRWNQFQNVLGRVDADLLAGPILDFGSGIGYFVREGLTRNMNIWGVDILPGKIARYRKLIEYSNHPEHWKTRCLVAEGEELPFASGFFAAVSTWYVFEHLARPSPCLREMVRVTRRHGVITIRAQDARNGWEGHCKIPWVPFLNERLSRVWIEEFGVSPELREDVYDVTQPQVRAILEELGCQVISAAAEPQRLIAGHRELSTEEEVRRKARQVKEDFENGLWQPQPENLYIHVRKM